MKKLILSLALVLISVAAGAKTLIVYYSFTNNVHTIATELQAQTGADMLRVEPADEGLDYAANGYKIGTALISAIRNNPDAAESYPAIKPVTVNLEDYDMIVVAAPLWWNNMAAPLQTFLFNNGAKMAGKKIGLIVSSASSPIDEVEADAHRLIPQGDFVEPSLWIRSAQTSRCKQLIADWLERIDYVSMASINNTIINNASPALTIDGDALTVEGEFDSLALYSLSGRKVAESRNGAKGIRVPARGTYVARLTANDRFISAKVVF